MVRGEVRLVGLALEAGGVKGFTHIATLKLLDMYDVRLNMIAGSSAGAIVGALYAMYGDADKVYEEFSTNVVSFMKDKSLKSSVPMFELVIKKALISLDDYYQFFKALFGRIKFSQLKTKLVVVAFDCENRESMVIDEGFLVDAVLASCTVPGVFEPTYLCGTKVLDGGVLSPLPTEELRKRGMDRIIASLFEEEIPDYQTQFGLLSTLDSIKNQEILRQEMQIADFVFDYPVQAEWSEFERYESIYNEALKIAMDRRDEFENFIRR